MVHHDNYTDKCIYCQEDKHENSQENSYFLGHFRLDRYTCCKYTYASKGGLTMSFILHQTNKKTGVIYAFEVESYRDPDTKKPKSRRTYLGRI